MDRFFSVFGKLVLVALIIGGVSYGSYFLGQNNKKSKTEGPDISPTQSPSPSIIASPTEEPKKTVTGGVAKTSGLSFSQYTLNVSNDWKETRVSQTAADEKLILEMDGYQISIFQAATGGALCLYPGDPDFEGPSSRYTLYKDLTTGDGVLLRRSGSNTPNKDGKLGFTVCQKGSDESFGQPTSYGHISITLPKGYMETTLTEIDKILSSLKKI